MLGKWAVITITFLLVLIMHTNPVFAEPYNISTDATKIYSEGSYCFPLGFTEPYDPKIACDTEGTNCIALVYEDNIYCSRGVRIIWSVDKFDVHASQIFTIAVDMNLPDAARTSVTWFNQYGLDMAYDVEYFDDFKAFFMVAKGKVYVAFTEDIDGAGPISPLPTVYDSVSTVWGTIGADLSTNCIVLNNDNASVPSIHTSDPWGVSFDDNNATNLLVIAAEYYNSGCAINPTGFLYKVTYDVTNTTTTPEYSCIKLREQSCPCPAGTVGTINRLVGIGWKSPTDWRYHIRTDTDYCSASSSGNDQVENWVALNSPAANQDNLHHIFASNLYYREPANNTVLQSLTNPPQYTSFGSPQLAYTEETGENVNQSDADDTELTNVWIWSRENASADNGVWVFREPNIPIIIETDVSTPVTAILECNPTANTTYSTTGSGDLFTIYTICQNNNRIIFTSNNRPLSHIEYFDIDSSCLSDSFDIKLMYANTPYNHTFNIRTQSNLPIPGANITIGSEVNTTDSNGQAIFELQTISGSTLYRNNYSTCEVRMSTDGAGQIKSYTVEKSGFVDESNTIPAPTKTFTNGYNIWSFTTETDEVMYETGMFLNISLRAGSDVPVSPCNYEVKLSGPDYIAVMINGVPNLGDTWDSFPVEFKLNHSSEPVNVTMNLTLPDDSYIVEYENMSYDERDDHIFFLPYTIEDLPCDEACDCPESTCIDQYFYEGLNPICGINGTCDYNVSNCILEEFCDDRVGCFQADTNISCTRDGDCPDSCVDEDTMIWGRCGADGLCKNVTYECAIECNQTANICEEFRLCEQGNSITFKAFVYTDHQINLLSATVNCDADRVDTYTCLPRDAITKAELDFLGKTIADVFITPDDWTYTTVVNGTNTWYNFSSVSVYCHENCSISYEVCDGICDEDTGDCIAVAGDIERTLANLLPSWLQWLLTSIVLWTFISLVVGALLTFLPARISHNAQPTPQLGLGAIFVMYILGIGLGFVNPLIGLMILIGLGLALAKMLSNMLG